MLGNGLLQLLLMILPNLGQDLLVLLEALVDPFLALALDSIDHLPLSLLNIPQHLVQLVLPFLHLLGMRGLQILNLF